MSTGVQAANPFFHASSVFSLFKMFRAEHCKSQRLQQNSKIPSIRPQDILVHFWAKHILHGQEQIAEHEKVRQSGTRVTDWKLPGSKQEQTDRRYLRFLDCLNKVVLFGYGKTVR